jgi:hypothetical protein
MMVKDAVEKSVARRSAKGRDQGRGPESPFGYQAIDHLLVRLVRDREGHAFRPPTFDRLRSLTLPLFAIQQTNERNWNREEARE